MWLLFVLFYWLVLKFYGDLNDVKIISLRLCFENVNFFMVVYLFLIEMQMIIGYGFCYVIEECLYVVVGVILQNIVGVGLQVVLVGFVVVKVR